MNFSKLFSKKVFILVICIFAIALVVLPSVASAAGIVDDILGFVGDVTNVPKAIFGFVAQMILSVPLFIMQVSLDLLNWVATGDFIKMSVTGPDNLLVQTGWAKVRDLANIALIFGLIIIAISIIVGYQETRAKKALVNFILIAILINFTPQICGLIIDASNMVMNGMLHGGIPNTFATRIAEKAKMVGLADIPTLVVFAIFSLISAAVYFLYALIFLVRMVMLWIHVIVSPIAFATKVFPESKYIKKVFPNIMFWDDWWEGFIQWCVIGIPAALFIWLSNQLMEMIVTSKVVITNPSGDAISGALGMLFVYSIPFIFLIVGFNITMSSGGDMGKKIGGLGGKMWAATGGAATGYMVGKATSAGQWAKGRAGAAASYGKEGMVGIAGGAISGRPGASAFSKEGREQGRIAVQDWKQRTKEGIASNRVTGAFVASNFATKKSEKQKQAEEFVKSNKISPEDYGKFKHRYSTEQREAYEEDFIRNNTTKFLKTAGSAEEYQRRMGAVMRHDDKSKEYELIKTKAVLDAQYKNKALAGKTNWEAESGITISKKIGDLSAKDLADSINDEALANKNIFSSLRTNQIKKIMDEGSGEKMDILTEIVRPGSAKRAQYDKLLKDLNAEIHDTHTKPERLAEAQKQYRQVAANIAFISNKVNPRPQPKPRKRVKHP